jgi:hypothetical protein
LVVFSTLPLSCTLSPSPPQFQAGPVLPLSWILLNKGHMHNKKDKVFLVVELRIANRKIPTIALMYACVSTHIHLTLTDLYLCSQSPAHDNLSFKGFCISSSGVGTSNAFMLCVFYLFLYLPYVLSLCQVIQVQQHSCICPRSKVHI